MFMTFIDVGRLIEFEFGPKVDLLLEVFEISQIF